jgi:hypothetical protein
MKPSYRLEVLLFKLEILDHKARERAGAITPTFIGPVPVLLQLDTAMEVKLHSTCLMATLHNSDRMDLMMHGKNRCTIL